MHIEKTDLMELIAAVVKETIGQLGIVATDNPGKRGKAEHPRSLRIRRPSSCSITILDLSVLWTSVCRR